MIVVLVMTACAPAPVIREPAGEPPLPGRTAAGAAHYRVVDEGTRVYARVFRGGSMARLGHNHVVLFPGVRGDVYLTTGIDGSLFDLVVPVAGAEVDPPELRRDQGRAFRTDISDDARARTRGNMLGERVLDAARYPHITVSSTRIEGRPDGPLVTLDITIRATTRRLVVPVTLRHGADSLRAEGRLELLQSEFGIEPFTVLGGALRVEDRVELVFTVSAERAD
ncbi:MAG: YceI family protein [Gammaproteobacteria bacterium]|nr:YceI family protein [Gammaproteobacteria bacterium]